MLRKNILAMGKDISLRRRLYLIATLIVVLVTILGAANVFSALQIHKSVGSMAEDAAPTLGALGRIEIQAGRVTEEALSCAIVQCHADGPFAETEFAVEERRELEQAAVGLERAIEAYRSRLTDPDEIRMGGQLAEAGQTLVQTGRRIVQRVEDGAGVERAAQELDSATHAVMELVNQARADEQMEFRASLALTPRLAEQGVWVAATTLAALILLFWYLAAKLNATVFRPLLQLKKSAEAMGEGRLETRVELNRADELGAVATAFNRMAASLQQESEERQATIATLHESEERFRMVAENVQDIVVRFDLIPEPHFAYVSPAATRITGYTPEEHYADPELVLKLAHPDDLPRFLELVQSPEEFADIIELRYVRKDGEIIWVEMHNRVIYDEEGQLISAVGITRDITERKNTEEELRRAKEEAEAGARAKSEFLANMSHEIRTPLNAVIGMTGLLLDTPPLTTEQRNFVETIRTSGDSLLNVINDVLDFSKIEAHKLELERQPFSVRQSVEDALDLVAVQAGEKTLELAYFLEPEVPASVVGDVTRMRQILVNLLSNAVKFTREGEVVVTVASRLLPYAENVHAEDAQEPHGHELHFTVRDTGIGIPPDKIDRLFKSFSQIDASTTRQYGGTGLGLAISKHLSEIMGGGMWAESDGVPGHGSSFHFTVQVQHNSDQPASQTKTEGAILQGKRVLVVDDNSINRFILTRNLAAWGMESIAAASGPDALALVRDGASFDLAILDMCMPEMDGVALARRLQEMDASAQMPLVMLSSLACSSIVEDSDGVDLTAVLAKPVKQHQLHQTLIDALTRWRSDQPSLTPVANTGYDAKLAEQLPLRILFAEDNMVNQKVTRQMLSRLGYRVDAVGNGVEALSAVKAFPYDVVLMDVQMPEMDGLEATRHIRDELAEADPPYIIAMTAHAMAGDADRCRAAGMNDYIAKPVQVDKLIAALKRSVAHARVMQPG